MQEEVEQKSLTLTVNAAKMTARLFRAAIAKYVAHKKEKKHDAQTGVRYVGRQSVKKLVGQNQGVSNVELSGEDIKAFERVARKYGVDYAVKKVKGDAPRFLIFFKARDADALNAFLAEHRFAPILAHAPYTLNACAADASIREFAVRTMREDLQRLAYIPTAMLNFHPGSHVKQGVEVGVRYIADLLDAVMTDEVTTPILLETMAGKGLSLIHI